MAGIRTYAFVAHRQAALEGIVTRNNTETHKTHKTHPAQVTVWILTSVAIVFGGLWAVFTYFTPKASRSADESTNSQVLEKIQTVAIEARLTCVLAPDAVLPPAEVTFVPVGDSHSYLEGPGGTVPLTFQSPVRFRRQDDDSVVVINRFVLPPGSPLYGEPVEAFKRYDFLSVPIVTVVYGDSLEKMRLLEVIFTLNGEDVWYERWPYNEDFRAEARFSVPLVQLHARIQ